MIEKSQVRYFAVHPTDIPEKWQVELWPENDTLPLDILRDAEIIYPRSEYGQTDSHLSVISVLISPAMEAFIGEQVGMEDPFSPENALATVMTLDITGKIFRSLDHVEVVYPQTAGSFDFLTVDEDGNPVVLKKMKMNRDQHWAI